MNFSCALPSVPRRSEASTGEVTGWAPLFPETCPPHFAGGAVEASCERRPAPSALEYLAAVLERDLTAYTNLTVPEAPGAPVLEL